MYYKPGWEPVEHDPKKMREGAIQVWEKFTATAKTNKKAEINEDKNTQSNMKQSSREIARVETTSDDIARKGKMA
jgi:uncharacterized protein Yka (UPF0111/DUF47 family)